MLETVCLHIVSNLKDGYYTNVGERGVKHSRTNLKELVYRAYKSPKVQF